MHTTVTLSTYPFLIHSHYYCFYTSLSNLLHRLYNNSSLELDCIWIIYQKLRNQEQAFWFHMKIFFRYTWSPGMRPVWDLRLFFIWLVENTAHSALYAPVFQKNHPQRAKLCRLEEIKVHFPWDSWCGFVFSFLSFCYFFDKVFQKKLVASFQLTVIFDDINDVFLCWCCFLRFGLRKLVY